MDSWSNSFKLDVPCSIFNTVIGVHSSIGIVLDNISSYLLPIPKWPCEEYSASIALLPGRWLCSKVLFLSSPECEEDLLGTLLRVPHAPCSNQ